MNTLTNRRKRTAISIALALAASLSLGTSESLTMDPPKQQVATSNRGNLSPEFQKELTLQGHDLLTQIYSGKPVDLANSTLFKDMSEKFGKEFYANQYSALAGFAPSNLVRWFKSSTDDTYNTSRKNQITSILAITWALEDLATKQGDAFERGSFSLMDPDHRLYNFLLDYVKLTTGYANPQEVPYALTTCNFAYRRDPSLHGSSHHNGHCPQSQFGIDVRFAPSEGVLKLLPYDTTHMLFAMLDIGAQQAPLLFMKWEEIGMGSLGATLYHGAGFHGSQANVANEARREKDIPVMIKQEFEALKQAIPLTEEHKTIRSMILDASRLLNITAKDHQDFLDSSEILLHGSTLDECNGIKLDALATRDRTFINATIYDKAKSFLDTVNKIYPMGNNHLRCGNEVILDLSKYQG